MCIRDRVILAAVVSSFAGSLGGEEAKAPQLAISAEAKSGDSIIVHHESGDPLYLYDPTWGTYNPNFEVRTFIPEGTYRDMSYKVDMSKVTEIGNGNGVIETGESFKIDWNDAFGTGAYGLMAPNPGERVVIEIYEKGGDKPIAKTTAVVRP